MARLLQVSNEAQYVAVHLCAGVAAKASGHFLPGLAFAQVTLSLIVVEGYAKVMQEQQVLT